MIRRLTCVAFSPLLITLIAPVAAYSALTPPPSLEAQFEKKGAIVIEADVVASSSATVTAEDGDELIVTYFELSTTDVEQENVAAPERLILPGGTLGDWTVIWADAPTISVGEHVVLVGTVDSLGVVRLASFGNSVFRRAVADTARPWPRTHPEPSSSTSRATHRHSC